MNDDNNKQDDEKDIKQNDKDNKEDLILNPIICDYNYENMINDNICGSPSILKLKIICSNKNCDHINHDSEWEKNNIINIKKIDTLSDLILFSSYYHCKKRKFYNGINMKILFSVKEHLEELDKMIGLTNIKKDIVNLVIHLLLNSNYQSESNKDMLHCVVTGSPGCGKTTFIEILAKIFTKLGILKFGHIVKVKRSDLIGQYLGHTDSKTQSKIDDATGGILLIDEAYSLGNPDQKDSFSKECLDALNRSLTENSNFICIIAGYENALETSFFAYNEGLKRRFPFKFDILQYTSDELGLILYKKLSDYKYWEISFLKDELLKLIKNNFKYFENQGGDMDTLFINIKIVYNKRIFFISLEEKKKLLINDIKDALENFIKLKSSVLGKKRDLTHLYI